MNSHRCLLYMLSLCFVLETQSNRLKRFLLFPRQSPTRHQFIAGIGIPADLTYESLTTGHVLKAEFFLPWNETVFRQNPYLPEYTFTHESLNLGRYALQPTELRWQLYAYVEHMLNGYGYKGRECMLQAICEAKAIRFSRDFSVLQELLHIVLSPSSSLNKFTEDAADYYMAEKSVRQSNDALDSCQIYDCNMKLLDWISRVMNSQSF